MSLLLRLSGLLLLTASLAAAPIPAPADQPACKLDRAGNPDSRFMARHQTYVAIAAKGNVDLLLMGDFLIDDFRGHNKNGVKAIFDEAFARYRPANFGNGGDYTQHVLWRVLNGELEGIAPKVMMLMIGGTNGSNGEPGDRIAAGVKAIIDATRQKSPRTKVLLLSVLPWDAKPGSRRERHIAVNAYLAPLDDGGKTVKYVDISGKFLAPDGTIPKEIMPDGAHLNDQGYQIFADAVKQPLQDLFGPICRERSRPQTDSGQSVDSRRGDRIPSGTALPPQISPPAPSRISHSSPCSLGSCNYDTHCFWSIEPASGETEALHPPAKPGMVRSPILCL